MVKCTKKLRAFLYIKEMVKSTVEESKSFHYTLYWTVHICTEAVVDVLDHITSISSSYSTNTNIQALLQWRLTSLLSQVRGAPAIAIVGCLSLAVELRAGAGGDDPVTFIRESLCHLTSARPTAVNMGRAARELMEFAENESMEKNSEQLRERWAVFEQ